MDQIKSFNQLTSLPDEIVSLSRLATLMLELNQLSELPKEVGNLESLIGSAREPAEVAAGLNRTLDRADDVVALVQPTHYAPQRDRPTNESQSLDLSFNHFTSYTRPPLSVTSQNAISAISEWFNKNLVPNTK